jgi:hypothetical protein
LLADTEVADGVAAENVAEEPNETWRLEMADAAVFVIVAVRVPVVPMGTLPNCSELTVIGAGTVADSGTTSVKGTLFTVPAIVSVPPYVAGVAGPVNDSVSDDVAAEARLVGSGVVVIAKGDEIVNARSVIDAPVPLESVTLVVLLVPMVVFANETAVTATGAVTEPDTGTFSVNVVPFQVPVMSSVSV